MKILIIVISFLLNKNVLHRRQIRKYDTYVFSYLNVSALLLLLVVFIVSSSHELLWYKLVRYVGNVYASPVVALLLRHTSLFSKLIKNNTKITHF